MLLRFLTAGESHGPALTVIVEGLPAGLAIDLDSVGLDLRRRRGGYGRGGRMKIESDPVEVLGGIRFGKTLGSPVSLVIRNLDHANWTSVMAVDGEPTEDRKVTAPRPGHADLAGALKYGTYDARDILERSSARETAARTAAGALARQFLAALGIQVTSSTISVGEDLGCVVQDEQFDDLVALPDDAPFRCLDDGCIRKMTAAVEQARKNGDSVGGAFQVMARGVPVGLGSHVHWDRKLDGLLGQAMMSIPAVKAVSIGDGVEGAFRQGSRHHDPIGYRGGERRFDRPTNRAGGIEGGMSNGEMIRVTGYLKPLSTLPKPLTSADLVTKEETGAAVERTDTIPIVAAGVVGEAMVALVLAGEGLRKFGGDSMAEVVRNLESYRSALRAF
jgi:chorismate synthase